MKKEARGKFVPALPLTFKVAVLFYWIAVAMTTIPFLVALFSLDSRKEVAIFLQLTNFSFVRMVVITASGIMLAFPALWLGTVAENPEKTWKDNQEKKPSKFRRWAYLTCGVFVGITIPLYFGKDETGNPERLKIITNNFTDNAWIFSLTFVVSVLLLLLGHYQNAHYGKWASTQR